MDSQGKGLEWRGVGEAIYNRMEFLIYIGDFFLLLPLTYYGYTDWRRP